MSFQAYRRNMDMLEKGLRYQLQMVSGCVLEDYMLALESTNLQNDLVSTLRSIITYEGKYQDVCRGLLNPSLS